jgi:predicted amidophosphoribosyltransferase
LPAVWIGLVDDVMTTGSTMHFAALALRRGGAAGVVALSAMRTPRLVWHNTQHV